MVGAQVNIRPVQSARTGSCKLSGFKFRLSLVISQNDYIPGYVGHKIKIYPLILKLYQRRRRIKRFSRKKYNVSNICQQRRYKKKVGKHSRPFRPLKMVSCPLLRAEFLNTTQGGHLSAAFQNTPRSPINR